MGQLTFTKQVWYKSNPHEKQFYVLNVLGNVKKESRVPLQHGPI